MSGISANILLGHIVQSFSNWLETWSKDGFESVREAWLERAKGLGEGISVRLPDRSLDGVFKGLTPSGALILEISGEGERIIPAGDVYFPPKT